MNIDLLRSKARFLGLARGLLFLVDPLRIRAAVHDPRLHLTEKESRVPAADYLNDVRKLTGSFPRAPVKALLAIVLNKLDRWGHLMDEGSALREVARSILTTPPCPAFEQRINDEVQAALHPRARPGSWNTSP